MPPTRHYLAVPLTLVLLTACTPEDLDGVLHDLEDLGGQTASADTDLTELIKALDVSPEEQADTYDRDAFGDYDRNAALQDNQDEFTACDGYYSLYDDVCHPDDSAVDIDEVVAPAEAWRSGAHDWPDTTLDEFGQDPTNLVVMTSEVNQHEKSDNDPADWQPQTGTCEYVEQWATVKTSYDLTVDENEVDALQEMATGC